MTQFFERQIALILYITIWLKEIAVMRKYDTVLFDLDGTLLNTLEDLTDSVNFALNLYGFPNKKMMEIRSYLGNGIARLIALSIPKGMQNSHYEDCLSEFRLHYAKNVQNKTAPYEGIREVLEYLVKENYKIAVVSNKFDQAVKELAQVHFTQYIQTAFGEAEDVPRKPAPDMVFKALESLDAEARRAVYIGDSEVDVKTARNAGILSIGVTWGFRDRDVLERAGADYIIDHPQEIIRIISQ